MKTLLSYHNDTKLKKDFLREITKHIKDDAVLQGTYGKQNGDWKGCAVACSLRSLAILDGKKLKVNYGDHSLYETKLGVPEWLARLEDTLFEGLPKEDAKKWVGQFSKAIPVGINLEPIKYKFCAFILKENIDRVLSLKDIDDSLKKQVVKAIQGVLTLHEKAIKTGSWDNSATWSATWSAAESAARSAESATWSAVSAESAARSAVSAASTARSAESATWSAARSAESATWSAVSAASTARSAESATSAARSEESATWSAARSAAWSAARSAVSAASAARSAESATWSAVRSEESAAYKKYANQLLKLLKEAK